MIYLEVHDALALPFRALQSLAKDQTCSCTAGWCGASYFAQDGRKTRLSETLNPDGKDGE